MTIKMMIGLGLLLISMLMALQGCTTRTIAAYKPVHVMDMQVTAVSYEKKKVWFFQKAFWNSDKKNLDPIQKELDRMYQENGSTGKQIDAQGLIQILESEKNESK